MCAEAMCAEAMEETVAVVILSFNAYLIINLKQK
jgi:hypothetical protein